MMTNFPKKIEKLPNPKADLKDYTPKELIGKKVKYVFGLACSPKALYEDNITWANSKRIRIEGCETQFDWDGNDVRFLKQKSQSHVSKIILAEA